MSIIPNSFQKTTCNTVDYTLIEVFQDIQEIRGIDSENYKLSKGDISYIPRVNAEGLERRKLGKILKSVFLRVLNPDEYYNYYQDLRKDKDNVEKLIRQVDENTIQVNVEDPICKMWIESITDQKVCIELDLVEEGLEGISIFNEITEVNVKEVLTEYVERIQKKSTSSVTFRSHYKVVLAYIAQGSLSLPIALIYTGKEPVRLGFREIYIQPIADETKKVLRDKPVFESSQFREGIFRKELLKKVGITDHVNGEANTKKDLRELWDEFLPLCYEEVLPIPESELQSCRNLNNVLERAITGGIEIDPILYMLMTAQIPAPNANSIDPEEYMPYAPHGLNITNSKTGKSTTASRISENVIRDATVSNLLGFSTSDKDHVGLLNGQVDTTFIDELTESMESEVSNGLSNYMETGTTYRARGTGIKVKGYSPIVFLGNPKTLDRKITNIEIYEIFQETLDCATGNPIALGSRLGSVLFDSGLKTAEGNKIENHISKTALKVLKTVQWYLRDDFSSLFKDKKVLAWLNRPFEQNYIEEIERISSDIPLNSIKEFLKGSKDAYRHVRGTALHIVFYSNFERYVKDDKPDTKEFLQECEEQFKILCELNLDSFRKIASIKIDRSVFQSKLQNAPEYISILLECICNYGHDIERIPYDDLEHSFKDLGKRNGKYTTFGKLTQNILKSIRSTKVNLNTFGFDIFHSEDVTLIKIIDKDVAAIVLDIVKNNLENTGYTGYTGYNNTTDNDFNRTLSVPSVPCTLEKKQGTGKTQTVGTLYPVYPVYPASVALTSLEEYAKKWKQLNKTEINRTNLDKFTMNFLIDQGSTSKNYDLEKIHDIVVRLVEKGDL
ncbi:hypothetical protein [Methanolobus sp. WCC5]|uniref:hypothetical protein n=1 Tax=Methanolobus sp. WCC5 TaxID=3125785 RepID=UPI00324DF2F7